jgi:hypothetical protein
MHVGKKTFAITIWLLMMISFSSCNWGKTSSRERFERNCHIIIPADVQVLKDEYHDLTPQYAIIYEVKIGPDGMRSLINNVRRSVLYRDVLNTESNSDEYKLQIDTGDRGSWKRTETGYTFFMNAGKTQYSIDIDTAKRILTAWEGYAD